MKKPHFPNRELQLFAFVLLSEYKMKSVSQMIESRLYVVVCLFVCWRRLVESHGANNVARNPKKSVSLYLMRLATSDFF